MACEQAISDLVFTSSRRDDRAVMAVRVTKGDKERTFTFCLQRIEQGPYKVTCLLVCGLLNGCMAKLSMLCAGLLADCGRARGELHCLSRAELGKAAKWQCLGQVCLTAATRLLRTFMLCRGQNLDLQCYRISSFRCSKLRIPCGPSKISLTKENSASQMICGSTRQQVQALWEPSRQLRRTGATSTPPTGGTARRVGPRKGSVGATAADQGSLSSLTLGYQLSTMRTSIRKMLRESVGCSTSARRPAVCGSMSASSSSRSCSMVGLSLSEQALQWQQQEQRGALLGGRLDICARELVCFCRVPLLASGPLLHSRASRRGMHA